MPSERSRGGSLRSESGQAMLETFIASLLALVMILGIIQIAILFNAHSMVKLAAFNAARAAIVARGDKPEDPVTREEMERAAKLAAFVTLIPVIPSIQGRQDELLSLVDASRTEALGELLSFDPDTAQPELSLPASFGGRAGFVAAEYEFFLDVRIVRPDAPDPTLDSARAEFQASSGRPIEFDDPARPAENVVKVLVEWRYPLVIPFVNRIFVALANPEYYQTVFARPADIPDYEDAVRSGRIPIWALGTSFGEIFRRRIPVRGTYVMRMQWDRGPS